MARSSEPHLEKSGKLTVTKGQKKGPGRLRGSQKADSVDTGRKYSLAHLTVIGLAPPEVTYVAARAEYDYVSLRLIPIGVEGESIWWCGCRINMIAGSS